jgi:hypothetical protein
MAMTNALVRLWLVAIAVCGALPASAEPYTPRDDAAVLERLSIAPSDPDARQLQQARATLAVRPSDLAAALHVARLDLQIGRAQSDPRYYGYAQGALAPWWSLPAPPLPVLVLRATIRQHDHDFDAALQDLAHALQTDPRNAEAWLTQAVVQTVRGDYAAARQSCLQVLPLAPSLVGVTCLSGVDSLTGNAEPAYDRLRHALQTPSNADAATLQWSLTALAEIAARRGDARRAEAHFRQALGFARRDDYLLAAFADFLLDQDRAAEVRTLLADETRVDALLLRLALAESQLGAAEAGPHIALLRDRFAAARLRGDRVHRREEARFALYLRGDARAALRLARANWAVQREPADARILLEAARAAGDRAAAAPVLQFVADNGLQDLGLARAAAALGAGS